MQGIKWEDYTGKGAKDYEIAAAAEKYLMKISKLAEKMGLLEEEVLPYGHYVAKIDFPKVLERLKDKKDGKYIDVTAITPTPLGEGKSTTILGLVQGMGLLGLNVAAAIRQPSGGPTMNIKGSAAGGGMSQCLPLTPFSLGLTGDINAIMNAHNLGMVALNSRMQHEENNTDKFLESRGLSRLNIDPDNVGFGFVMDLAAQCLRNIIIGIGGKRDGFLMQSKFGIAVSSELMAILALASDLPDLRRRIGQITLAYSKEGKPVTANDLEVGGAMTAWMVEALKPNLLQTIEGQPCFVHAGPFANIAIGQSSIIADRVALKLVDYHVTESGFAADIGFEKFWNLKCRYSGLIPNAAVVVATVRALKCHGGAPVPKPGNPLPEEYSKPNVALVEKGVENLLHHVEIVKKSGISPVVCINAFVTDTKEEIAAIRNACERAGARVAVSEHWLKGGEGALELAHAVKDACEEKTSFKLLYSLDMPFKERISLVAREIYGADGVDYSSEAEKKLALYQSDATTSKFGLCMVKTHLSLSGDPNLKGVPKNYRLYVRDALIYSGAEFVVPVVGDISLMPGTASDPAFRRIEVETDTGKITGLF
ncbi:MAG: formate--tetrahydrofolate ligase [Deltaproteobacteria bacterium]|jgi:formate--tetrahydrofolate ligase|nr:formate--tetrahydrofolate ligase [Deltaproteobacteria bacterium]